MQTRANEMDIEVNGESKDETYGKCLQKMYKIVYMLKSA